MHDKIAILLATYNGAEFLEEQINSVINQQYENWDLIIRDDFSTDATRDIIKRFSEKDSRIFMLNDESGRLGAKLNFNALMEYASNRYVRYMFCDQDDIWKPGKIGDTLQAMDEMEAKHGTGTPILVYTSFTFVSSSLVPFKKQGSVAPIFTENDFYNTLFVQNSIYGCTVMINKALLQLSVPIPRTAENHDFWIALVAAAFGHIKYVAAPTILYRQHAANVTSVYASGTLRGRIDKVIRGDADRTKDWNNKVAQVMELNNRFAGQLSAEKKALLDKYIHLLKGNKFSLILFMIRNKMIRRTRLQTIIFFMHIIKSKKVNLNHWA